MLPGPDQVIACPSCGAFALVSTLMSGNTCGARFWTDGKMLAPMLPTPPSVTKCRHCRGYFWVADAKIVGEVAPWEHDSETIPKEWRRAEPVADLAEAEFLEAITLSVARNKDEEMHLRVSAWHAGNDAYREGVDANRGALPPSWKHSPEAIDNLERLAALLTESDPDRRLMKAEIMRELGRFPEALRLLRGRFPRDYTFSARFIRDLTKKEDPIVRELSLEEPR